MEPIGKECSCLHTYDKGIIISALRSNIETLEKSIGEARSTTFSVLSESLIGASEMMIGQYRTILERVEAMSDCS